MWGSLSSPDNSFKKEHLISYTRKMVPLAGRPCSFLEFFLFLKPQTQSKLNPNQIQVKSNHYFALLTSSVSRANLSSVVATVFSSLAFLSSSISMANLSHLVAASFSSLALLSSSISTANLCCLLATTFSSLSFLSNSFSSSHFNILRVARRCFSWSSISDDLFLFLLCFFFVLLLALSFSRLILGLSFLCSSVSEAMFA